RIPQAGRGLAFGGDGTLAKKTHHAMGEAFADIIAYLRAQFPGGHPGDQREGGGGAAYRNGIRYRRRQRMTLKIL
ncbi:hypothetical protein, partial [Photorhabdus sp. RM96S]|uniref:hypothetical protein n=1 Tax=Photorhabdus sp. RM96S TaxID=3342822 RepID=UPI0036DC1F59